jgi:hypothetical protein
MKAPAAARALPNLAERARQEEWTHERFLEAVLATEQASRDAHAGVLLLEPSATGKSHLAIAHSKPLRARWCASCRRKPRGRRATTARPTPPP